MKNFIIGTSGHVDHGKTTLIKALTGRDTDRLTEEKKRGITIELGFTYIDLPHFKKTGIIDVPGHEKFVKNMLMGSGGIDFVMLVIAADESIMPQTTEHLDILNLLGIEHGMVVISKKDLVDNDTLSMCIEEIKELVKGTFLENSKILPVSSTTGEGIEELKNIIDEELLKLDEKNTNEPFRLCVDRSFTLKGIGTVITGTVLNGKVDLNTECVLLPKNIPLKIRSLQVHNGDVETAFAGERLAMNIANLKKEDIDRGDIIAKKDSLTITKMLDCKIKLIKNSEYKLKNNSFVHMYMLSRAIIAKVVLMGRDILNEGEECYAQLRFNEDIIAKKNDTFIIRFLSPEVTIGGGVILDKDPIKKKSKNEEAEKSIEIREIGKEIEQVYQVLKESKNSIYNIDTIIDKGSFKKDNIKNYLNKLLENKNVVKLTNKDNEEFYMADVNENRIRLYTKNILSEYHKENNLKEGMSLEALRSKLINEKAIYDCDLLIDYWKNKKIIKENNGLVSLYEFKIEKAEGDEDLINKILKRYKDVKFEIPILSVIEQEFSINKRFKPVLTSLLKEGKLVKLDDKTIIHRENLDYALQKLKEIGNKKPIVLGEYRDAIGASRKIALAILDYCDYKGWTVKNGDERTLKPNKL